MIQPGEHIVAPQHQPLIRRSGPLGKNPISNRQVYGTTLRCSCGEYFGRVSNRPPSRGGKEEARAAFRQHITELDSVRYP